jgi:hypothetical protein
MREAHVFRENELDALTHQMAQKDASSKKLLEEVSAAAQAEKIRLQSDISSHTAKINSLEAQLAVLIQQRDESNKEIAALQDGKTSLSVQIVQLQGVSFDCWFTSSIQCEGLSFLFCFFVSFSCLFSCCFFKIILLLAATEQCYRRG